MIPGTHFPKNSKPVYGFFKGEYIGVMSAKEWSNMHGVSTNKISESARKRIPYKDWFFNYENKYDPKKIYETI